ncbi:response regulator transcription factor [Aestuariispira ectoiniformans]|uniref:response regulator transcription factor n=1 Tax=Aestuariispira ectoiniformans TaxID=2775080 RepID=UPI00223C495F|nr:response regulator [Aestuariispira ectoiniformans]
MGTTILIAEDEPYIVESLNFLLSREGHRVVSVNDGAAVLETVQREKPDLLVLDVMLPTSNGFEILRQIRNAPGFEDLPVLALTAKGQEADRKLMLDLGANEFVTKPFSNQDLVDRISGLLAQNSNVTHVAGGHE